MRKPKIVDPKEAIPKLPQWAQDHIAALEKVKDAALHNPVAFIVPPQPIPAPGYGDPGTVNGYAQHWNYSFHQESWGPQQAKVKKVWRSSTTHRDYPPGEGTCGTQGCGRGFATESDAYLALYCEIASKAAERLALAWNGYTTAKAQENVL